MGGASLDVVLFDTLNFDPHVLYNYTVNSSSTKDKAIFESQHAWLNDMIINSAQRILHDQCGNTIVGWQPTLYEQKPSRFAPIVNAVFQFLTIRSCHS